MKKSAFICWMALVLSLVLQGCSSVNSKVGGAFGLDTDVSLKLIAAADINPDDKGRPSPLVIRLYELKTPRQFERANFIDLFERAPAVLGADLVGKQVLKPLKPGEERKDKFVIGKEARYVGLVAEFLQYKNAKYKVIVPIAAENLVASGATIRVSGNLISAE